MQPRQQSRGQDDLFRSRLDQIIDMRHDLVRLGQLIDWELIGRKLGEVYTDAPGQPPLPTRLMAGLAILKHMHNVSDEVLCARWVENPYYQHFCGEEHFRHTAPFDRSSMTRWRQRMGDERLEVLLQESLTIAVKTEAIDVKDLSKVIVDTTVQEKAITFPTEAKLKNRARVMLVTLANKHGLKLRQGYPKVGKLALMKHQRYAHAKHFKRARRELRRLKTYLGRVIRDIDRQVRNNPSLNAIFRPKLFLAQRVHDQERGQRGRKVYSVHAPEVECIGKGKAHRPYEFGVKVSVATTVVPQRGGQFVLAAKALPGAPYDGHTLSTVIPHVETIVGNEIKRIIADKGYRGHGATKWYAALGRKGPVEKHPSWPADNTNVKGADTWRCKSCHGWDYLGRDGLYKSGPNATGIRGVQRNRGRSVAEIVAIIENDVHGYTDALIPGNAKERLALFISKGRHAVDQVFLPNGQPRGNLVHGREAYQNVCAACHGFDGKARRLGLSADPTYQGDPMYVGSKAKSGPIEMLHKIRNGHPGAVMVSLRSLPMQAAVDILPYVRTLPTR